MKQIFKVIVISSLAIAMIAPLTASAAWWNPFSWFKKEVPAVSRPTVDSAVPAPTGSAQPTTVVDPKKDVPVNTTQAYPTKTPVSSTGAIPADQKPVQTKAPKTPTSSPTIPQKPVVDEVKVEIPTFALNSQFTPSGFVSPRNVKNGTTLLTIESVPGKTQALGTWYVDSVTWRIVSEAYRSGDLTVSLVSGQKIIEDTSVINESHTTKISSHVASDPISFVINGQTPRKGMVRIVVESIKGHTSTKEDVEYVFGGTPLTGPDFSISSN